MTGWFSGKAWVPNEPLSDFDLADAKRLVAAMDVAEFRGTAAIAKTAGIGLPRARLILSRLSPVVESRLGPPAPGRVIGKYQWRRRAAVTLNPTGKRMLGQIESRGGK
jgi:hypothetical protein